MNDDRELRRRFAELRDADRAFTPQIARTLASRVVARTRWRAFGNVAGLAAVVAVVVVSVILVRGDRAPAPSLNIAEWRPASDMLLEIGRPPQFERLQSRGTSSLNALVPLHTQSGVRQ